MDYVDVIMCHRPDDHWTPIEETVRAMAWLVNKGYAHYWGTSEWPPHLVIEAIQICKRLHLPEPVVEQPEYSMIVRDRFEKEYRPLYEKYGIGTTTWSPLAMGILTGKYNDGMPEDARFAKVDHPVMKAQWNRKMGGERGKKVIEALKKLGEYAQELGYTQAQLALAWVLANGDVSTCLMGFSKIE